MASANWSYSLFDNIYIGHSVEDAQKLKQETWDIKHESESAEKEEERKKAEAEKPKSPLDLSFKDDPVGYIKSKTETFLTIAKQDPITAVKAVPEVAGAAGVLLVTILAVLLGGIGGASKSPKVQEKAKQAKDAAAETKDKVADAAATGAEKVQTEVNKRTTRSSTAGDQ